MQDFLDELEEMHSRTRNYESNGYKFLMQVSDPYGFWTVQALGIKRQPEMFQQQFTTITDAQRACTTWAESQSKVPATDTVEESPVEAIKYKKPRVTALTK